MEIFRHVSIDWLGKKWYFFGLSWTLLAIGVIAWSLHGGIHGGLVAGIDFMGGTVINLKFNQTPNVDRIRDALKSESVGATIIQRYGNPSDNAVMVRMQATEGGQNVGAGRNEVEALLRKEFDPQYVGSPLTDFNNWVSVGVDVIAKYLLEADPDKLASQSKTALEVQTHYHDLATAMITYRDKEGVVASLDDLRNVPSVNPAVMDAMKDPKKGFYAGSFAIIGDRSVGAVVGADLRNRATLAVGLSFLGMLVYIGFRFKPIYGVGAIVALFHDILITLGLFALTQKEISLTVIAALLTLTGYSVNDTIVVFDRVRENLRMMRKDPLLRVLNLSINQTLSRTIMTSGMTFLSVLALLVFGGEVLSGFSFALTVGIIIGTYSSIAIASPIVEWWYRTAELKAKRRVA